MANEIESQKLYTPNELLESWRGNRRLTRRTIDKFPEDKLYTFSIGGMRPFGELANEILGMALPTIEGVATARWSEFQPAKPTSKVDLLAQWDAQTPLINEKFPTIPYHRFAEVDKAFGQWEMPGLTMIQYVIDNEIHHRAQGFVYLRALGIEPPPFWDRS